MREKFEKLIDSILIFLKEDMLNKITIFRHNFCKLHNLILLFEISQREEKY
jgi:hypothetical protein